MSAVREERRTAPVAGRRPGLGPATGLTPAVVYLLAQSIALLAVAVVAGSSPWSLRHLLQEWDGGLYLRIARSGYSVAGPAGEDLHAFFPGYPLAVRAFGALTGLDLDLAAIGVSVLSGVVLAYGLDRLTVELGGTAWSVRLSAVFLGASLPLAVVFVMAYSEALFCALAVWCLVFVLRRGWTAAAVCACAAGAVRPTGVALVAALATAAVAARRQRDPQWRFALAACLVAPLGALAYLAWAALDTGRSDAWSHAQAQSWHTRFDFGAFFLRCLRIIAGGVGGPMEVAVLGAVLVCVAALIAMLRRRLPAPLVAYVAVVLVLAVGTSGVWNSKYRMLMPALVVIAVLAATATVRWRPPSMVPLLAAVAAAGCWFGAFVVVAYPHAL